MKEFTYSVLAIFVLSLFACGSPPPGQGNGEVFTSSSGDAKFKVETIITGLQVPWSIVFTSDGRMLITERPGRVRVVKDGKLQSAPLATISDVEPSGESGLMGLALHPNFAENHLL